MHKLELVRWWLYFVENMYSSNLSITSLLMLFFAIYYLVCFVANNTSRHRRKLRLHSTKGRRKRFQVITTSLLMCIVPSNILRRFWGSRIIASRASFFPVSSCGIVKLEYLVFIIPVTLYNAIFWEDYTKLENTNDSPFIYSNFK